MRISDQRKNEIVREFQVSFKRDNSAELSAIPLAELRQADEMIGDRDLNSSYRLALRNRIRELEEALALEASRKSESYLRAWNLIVGILAGILITVVGAWLSK